ncbi:hypothetical protein ADU59_20955 [Pararhizobium polonicum]|jgi:hypothetical protein|uniref:Uncharacterized protein n=1 Tax=Pararhizobium polonicum TaxID=1612624 RepID=A0A1C7NXI0_9HYPH|nr:hypothetical protein [Pararhizobium polonicum]OBZ93701.1 hypothetical protein ADU59_20955 [Pararhizobium polonicum]
MPESGSEADFLALVEALRRQDATLSPLTAALVVAVWCGIAADSRTFARLFGIAHALVLREINMLAGPDAPLDIVRRESRTQRTHLKLSAKGEALCRLLP